MASSFSSESPPNSTEINQTLDRVLAMDALARSAQTRRMLEYLVAETLAGNAAGIKAYTIGLDVFEKPDDFDPNTDASVRVAVGRLRASLADAYATEEGKALPLHIHIPKGTYVPEFRRASIPKAPPPSNRGRNWTAATAAVLLIAIGTMMFLRSSGSETTETAEFNSVPTVDLLAVEAVKDQEQSLIANGIREQLLIDLSHIKSLRVRDLALLDELNPPETVERPGDYSLSTSINLDGSALNVRLASADKSILWASSYAMPQSDAAFYDAIYDAVGSIATHVGGERGAVSTDAYRRLAVRADLAFENGEDEYLCLVLGFAFDSTKDDDIRNQARSCLTNLVDGGSTNSSIHAQYALIGFLDWARSKGSEPNDPLINKALLAARRSVQLDPSNSVGFEHLGSILSAMGDREGAISAYEKGLKLTPWKPSQNFLLGWQKVLSGDWDQGMVMVNQGVAMSPFAPGYMRIPNALDLFRQEQYDASRVAAETVIQLGDGRGYVLAIAASIANGDLEKAREIRDMALAANAYVAGDPMREVRNSFSNPSVIADYEALFLRANFD